MVSIPSYKNLRFLVDLLRELIDIPFRALPLVRHGNQLRAKKHLLIIRLDGIGDFILFLDASKEYRRLYPAQEWEITLLGNQVWQDLAETLPYADRYWFMNTKRFTRDPLYRYRWLYQVRSAQFDLVIQNNYSRGYWLGDTIVRASGVSKRIGSATDLTNITHGQKQRSDRWYTDLIPAESQEMMELERNAKFMRRLGLTDFQPDLPKLNIPDNAQKRADSLLIRLGLRTSSSSDFRDFYILSPGAAWKPRQWPVERFAELARRIHDHKGWIGVICGGPGEKRLAQQLLALAENTPLLNLSGKINLIEFAGIIKRARVLIGNETSAVHIASAVGIPSICILGGGHFGRFMPYSIPNRIQTIYNKMDCFGCNWKCIYNIVKDKPVPCIEQIKVHQVMENIIHCLGTS